VSQLLKLLPHPRQRLGLFDGEPHCPPTLCQGVHDGLPNPPHGVGDEARAVCRIELAGSMQQADIALVDEVGEWQSIPLIFVGHLHHKTQIALNEFAQSLSIAGLDTAAQSHFFGGRGHRLPPYLSQVRR
jgi:hypothetical protein